ncbi:MAG: tetratricopeptide repeat protein [Myxococcaceae bacterium]|nr:tetratricopeptide repeat protein [Myxococcaceae bacterium]
MLRLLLLTLVPSLAVAAPRPAVVALLPLEVSPDAARFARLVEARTQALLIGANTQTVMDMKQVLAMAAQEGLDVATLAADANADRALGLLGADRVVAARLTIDGAGLLLAGAVRDGKKTSPFSVKLTGGRGALLAQASEALARATVELDGGTLKPGVSAQPESKSDAALDALGACWETALRQPMGVDAPVGLAAEELDAAVTACRAALKADASLRFASATLALLLAIGREDAEAERLLGSSPDSDPALMPWVLGRFWLSTRHQSNEAAVTFLNAVLSKHPNVLMLRSFEANTLAAMNEHARAAASWNTYLSFAPQSAFAQGRLSRSLARQGQHDAALAAAKKGLGQSPASREARLVLAARLIDAGKLPDAKATLQPLVDLPSPPAEAMLHLALAYLAANDVASAAPLFKRASERATGAKAYLTKGRALYGLAVCEARQGKKDAAKASFGKSLETGYRVATPDPALASIAAAPQAAAPPPALPANALYVALESQGAPTPETGQLAEQSLRAKLEALGAELAPAGEDKKAAVSVIKARHLKGYQVKLQVLPGETETGLKVQLMVLSYPEQALKGSWSVKAPKGKPEKLVPLLVARAVDDVAGDLDWKL